MEYHWQWAKSRVKSNLLLTFKSYELKLSIMDKKIDQYIKDMESRRMGPVLAPPIVDYAPLGYRLLWRCGLNIRPPLFQTFAVNFITNGLVAGLAFYGLLCLFSCSREPVAAGVLFGILTGWSSARLYAKEAKSLGLSNWKDYNPPQM